MARDANKRMEMVSIVHQKCNGVLACRTFFNRLRISNAFVLIP